MGNFFWILRFAYFNQSPFSPKLIPVPLVVLELLYDIEWLDRIDKPDGRTAYKISASGEQAYLHLERWHYEASLNVRGMFNATH